VTRLPRIFDRRKLDQRAGSAMTAVWVLLPAAVLRFLEKKNLSTLLS
jgi:hypothetical protein